MTSNLGKRVLKHGFVITTTILTCTALQADHNDQASNDKTQKFIQKAVTGGQMEVQMGQLAEQKAQSQQVKDLGATLVRDHTAANQQLQQIASAKNITLDTSSTDTSPTRYGNKSADTSVSTSTSDTGRTGDVHLNAHSGKEHRELAKLESESGAEFDKTFVRMAIKDHKKDISEFEHARTEVTDPQVTSFIDQTLPKLRNHLQMAQTAAKSVGVNEASISSDRDEDATTSSSAAGAAATTDVGTRGSDKPSSPASNPDANKQTSSYSGSDRLNGRTDADASGTIQQNANPQADLNANVGDHSVSASAGSGSADYSSTTDTTKKHKIFSTDKNDGKFLGIIPDPFNRDKHKGPSAGADVDVNGHSASAGASAGSESSSSSSDQK